jgi:hypothetical protein
VSIYTRSEVCDRVLVSVLDCAILVSRQLECCQEQGFENAPERQWRIWRRYAHLAHKLSARAGENGLIHPIVHFKIY